MSLRLRLFNGVLRAVVKPYLRRVRSPQALRRRFALATRFLQPPEGAHLHLRARWTEVTHGPARPDAALLYFHGGGYVAGSARTHGAFLAHLAGHTGLRIVAPDYRLAPEHPLPAAQEDAEAAWDALLAEGLSPRRIVLVGDSSGGGLALSLLARLCARGTPPAALIAFSPWTDLTGASASIRENAAADPLFPGERMAELTAFALNGMAPADPRLSPLFAAFPAAPPVLIQVGSTEILRDDAVRMAERLRGFGADVTLRIWPDCPHVWQMIGFLPEAQAALKEASAFLEAALRRSTPPGGS